MNTTPRRVARLRRAGLLVAVALVAMVTAGATGAASNGISRGSMTAAMPTRANTGPDEAPTATMSAARFLRTGRCDHRRIVGDVHVDDQASNTKYLDRRFSINSCTMEQFFWSIDGDYPPERYPTLTVTDSDIDGGMVMVSPMHLTIERSFVAGGFWAPCPNCTSQPDWDRVVRPMPVVVRDSLFVSEPGDPKQGFHVEALHVMGSGVGYQFERARFVQQGPYNGTQTGAINFAGQRSRWNDIWFDFGGTRKASYYTVYLGGPDNEVAGCHVEEGLAGYVYPDEEQPARYRDCVDFDSGKRIKLP